MPECHQQNKSVTNASAVDNEIIHFTMVKFINLAILWLFLCGFNNLKVFFGLGIIS